MKELTKLYEWYENLSETSLSNINSFYTPDAFFKDPFNEVNDLKKIERIFRHMFNQLENAHFVFIDKIEQNNQVFVTWNFIFINKGKTYIIHGSSHLKLTEAGLIFYHRDYWDVGEELLLKLPLIKNLYGMFRKKIGSS